MDVGLPQGRVVCLLEGSRHLPAARWVGYTTIIGALDTGGQPCVTFTSSRAQPCIAEESSCAQPYTHGYDLVSGGGSPPHMMWQIVKANMSRNVISKSGPETDRRLGDIQNRTRDMLVLCHFGGGAVIATCLYMLCVSNIFCQMTTTTLSNNQHVTDPLCPHIPPRAQAVGLR